MKIVTEVNRSNWTYRIHGDGERERERDACIYFE